MPDHKITNNYNVLVKSMATISVYFKTKMLALFSPYFCQIQIVCYLVNL